MVSLHGLKIARKGGKMRTRIRNRNNELLGTIEGNQQEDKTVVAEILHEIEMTRLLMEPLVTLLQQLRIKLHHETALRNPDKALIFAIKDFLNLDVESAKQIALLPNQSLQIYPWKE